MAKLEQFSTSGNEVFLQLGSLAILLSMVVAVLGIKFRWFKHRLSFEPIPNTEVTGIGIVGSYRNSLDQSQLTQGVFRRRDEDENVIERPVSLPPIRVRKTSRGPPPPLLPQKRTVVPKPPGQELIPETPSIEPTTPPAFTTRNKRDESLQKSPRIQIQEPLFEVKEEFRGEGTVAEVAAYEDVQTKRRPTSEIIFEPEVPKRTKKIRPKSVEVSSNKGEYVAASWGSLEGTAVETEAVHKLTKTDSLISWEDPSIADESKFVENEKAVHKPIRQRKNASIISFEDLSLHADESNQTLQRKDNSETKDQESDKTWEVVKSVQFDVEDGSEHESSIVRRDTGFSRSDLEELQLISVDFGEDKTKAEVVKSVQFDVEDGSEHESSIVRRDTGFSRPDLEELQLISVDVGEDFTKSEHTVGKRSSVTVLIKEASTERSVHFETQEIQEKHHSFVRRDTGIVRSDTEELQVAESEKSVHFDLHEEHFKSESTFERRDTGRGRLELGELQKSVNFDGVPDDEYWEIVPHQTTKVNETQQAVVILGEEEEEVLERKTIVSTPTIFLLDADEMHHETEIDALSDGNIEKPKIVPAPRRSKESATSEGGEEVKPQCITFEEDEPQQIAFADTDDNLSEESFVIDVGDYEKPKIVELKERPSEEPHKPVPRQRSITGTAPPLPQAPPPTSPDNGNSNWTAIQIHRNLTKELNAEIMEAVLKKSAVKEVKAKEEDIEKPSEEVDPPKNMRDMMRRKRSDYEFSGF